MDNVRNTILSDRHDATLVGYEALKGGSALVERPGRMVLRLTGKDPVGMLEAVLTNEIPKTEDSGVYALLLNPKGRVQTDLRVLRSGDGILVDAEPEGAAAALELLGRYAPFSRVRIEDLSDTLSVLGLYGPRAKAQIDGPDLAEHAAAEVEIGGALVLAAGVAVPVPGYDLLCPAEAVAPVREHLVGLGAVPAGSDAYETARVAAGVPRFGSDLTPENFPGEAGILERAVSFGKGCYPGQETVARMHYRGSPNKLLYRLAVGGKVPGPRAPILQADKQVGTVTSVAPLPVDGDVLALGYLSRGADVDGPLEVGGSKLAVLGLA